MIQHIKDWFRGYPLGGRSSRWRTVRKEHLAIEPECQICGKTKGLEVHHKIPFYVRPDLEENFDNLITLCNYRGNNCHFIFGHLFNYHSWNEDIDKDSALWKQREKHKPHK